MDSDLFKEWVEEIDRQFYRQKRRIALLIDNCPAYPRVENLKSVDLIFLPPNTTVSNSTNGSGCNKVFEG